MHDTLEPIEDIARRHTLLSGLNHSLAAQPVGALPAALRLIGAISSASAPSADTSRHVIVVLGIAVEIDGKPNPHFDVRVQNAYELAQRYPLAPLVVTGAYVAKPFVADPEPTSEQQTLIEAHHLRRRLQELGVDSKRILCEPRARHTVANLAYAYQKIEAELIPSWGSVDHMTVSMEPYHAVRAVRIAAALVASLPQGPSLHVSVTERLGAALTEASTVGKSRREAVLTYLSAQDIANLNRCQLEKSLLISGW